MGKAAKKITPKADEVEVFDIEQRSDDWHAVRRGLPTASKFSIIMAEGADGEDSKTRAKLLHVLAGEILTGETAESFRNEAMERGIEMEPEAREYYARTTFEEITQVGFVKRTIYNPLGTPLVIGCSPDTFVGPDGVLEIKVTRPDLLIPILRAGARGLPSLHRAQCQGTLLVSGRAWCDLLIYSHARMPKAKFRLERDDVYIKKIKDAVEVFSYDLRKLVEELRAMGALR